MQNYHELKVWQKAHDLTLNIYQVTESFPESERYGLTSQIRRASAPIPTNLAEGSGRGSKAELAQFAQISAGSTSEVEHLLELSLSLGYIKKAAADDLIPNVQEIRKMLTALIRILRTKG